MTYFQLILYTIINPFHILYSQLSKCPISLKARLNWGKRCSFFLNGGYTFFFTCFKTLDLQCNRDIMFLTVHVHVYEQLIFEIVWKIRFIKINQTSGFGAC